MAEVEACSPDYPSMQAPIATVSGTMFVLIINEAPLYFGDSLHFLSLLSPNQLRDHDVHVDDRHYQHAPDSLLGILIPSEPLHIPFTPEGVIAGFDTQPPTRQELDDTTSYLELMSDRGEINKFW